MRPTDLRGILGYTTHFRGETFVLSVDSHVLVDENFKNVLLDISVLRSLNVRLVIVHGATSQMRTIANRIGVTLTDTEGTGVTDEATMEVSVLGAFQLAQKILEGLDELNLRGAVSNAVTAHPSGIVDGTDRQWTGRVERIDTDLLRSLLDAGVIPVVPPIGFDGGGKTYRVHADDVAVAIARDLKAVKLIFIGTTAGVRDAGSLSAQFSVAEATAFLKDKVASEPDYVIAKLRSALRACQNGVNRAHLIDGLKDEALLSELFSNEGVGTMVYANEYESIRPARKKDVRAIRSLMRQSVYEQEVVNRSESELSAMIQDFFVFVIDGNVVGCVAVHPGEEEPEMGELACLVVSEAHANQGIGRKLVAFAERRAREIGLNRLYVLSTRAFNYFSQKSGYAEADATLLPPKRRERYDRSGRNSRILVKKLV